MSISLPPMEKSINNAHDLAPPPHVRTHLHYWKCCKQYWRLVLKITITIIYLIILTVCLPLLIWGLLREHATITFSAWFIAGIFMLLTLPIFLTGLLQHLINYTQPHLQKHIIRLVHTHTYTHTHTHTHT